MAIALAACLTATACSTAAPSETPDASPSAKEFTPVTIRLAFPTGVTSFANSDIVVADELGFFKDFGITIETTNLKAGGDAVKGVVSNSFDIGGASIEPVINAFAGGATLKIIASYTDRLEVDMVTPASIKTVEDLKGKNLGVQEVGSFREVMTRMVLESADLTQADVSYLPTNADAVVSGLVSGKIVSGILHPEQFVAAQEKDATLHSLVNLYEVEPDYYYDHFATQSWWTRIRRPPTVRRGADQGASVHVRQQGQGRANHREGDRLLRRMIAKAYDTYMVDVKHSRRTKGWSRSGSTTRSSGCRSWAPSDPGPFRT